MMPTIGIKIANGEFYSILGENSIIKKRLILTTAHDNQKSIQIDLYRSLRRSMADAQYIGSLVIENLKPRSKGVPSVELIIASNSKGELTADAVDLDASGQREPYHLSVSLASFDENPDITIPDYELENFTGPPEALYEKERSRRPLVLVGILGCIIILIGIVLWLLLPSLRPGDGSVAKQEFPAAPREPLKEQPPPVEPPRPVPPPPPPREQAPSREQAPPKEQAPPVIKAPAAPQAPPREQARQRPSAPVRNYRVPSAIPQGGVPYTIRWGDTLWDISEAFYRNPWLYTRIARFNGIRNPDRIIGGTTIQVPPKN